MGRRHKREPETSSATSLPPLLAYIEVAGSADAVAAKRAEAETMINRLYEQQADLITADRLAPDTIQGANTTVVGIAAEIADLADQLAAGATHAASTHADLRRRHTDACTRLAEARAHLDTLTREAADRARRLNDIAADIESWEARREKHGRDLVNARKRFLVP